ncbi:MAG: response regulator [Chloroflexota bacterium]
MVDKSSLSEAAEGTPSRLRNREPSVAKKTSSVPAVKSRAHREASTGKLPRFSTAPEGKEGDEKREATIIASDETRPADPDTRKTLSGAVTAAKKPSVLIVEDTEELAEVIQATLENKGMAVRWVSHGSRGITQIKKDAPDVLLLDIGLPDMTGWKMLEELREWKSDPGQLPTVVVITAYGDPANRLIGKLQGIHSYLIKPFTADEVEKVVEKALASTA